MKPCVLCKTFNGYNKDNSTIALQTTRYGNLCRICIDKMLHEELAIRESMEEGGEFFVEF
tara:strand:- start:531 stop:710 length:180 start_codon:yes stop_codon:yes gene_type:complete